MTLFEGITNTTDAAGLTTKITYPFEQEGEPPNTYYRTYSEKSNKYDGDGHLAVEVAKTDYFRYIGPYTTLINTSERKEYNVKSTVLDGLNVYTYQTRYFSQNGSANSWWTRKTNLFMDGKLLAVATVDDSSWTNFGWKHNDPTSSIIGTSGSSYKNITAVLDPTGADVKLENPYIDPDPPDPLPPFHGEYADPEETELVEVDGVLTPLALFPGLANIVSRCPKNGCGPIRTENGWEWWTAFADGYEGYVPMGGHYAGGGMWSWQTRQERNRRNRKQGTGRGAKPKLKTSPAKPRGSAAPTVNEADVEQPIIPEPFGTNYSWALNIVRAAVLIESKTKFFGFAAGQENAIRQRLLMTLLIPACVDAYKNFPGLLATPGEVLRDRGVMFINAPELLNSGIEAKTDLSSTQRESLLSGVYGTTGFYLGYPERTGAPPVGEYRQRPNQPIYSVLNLGSLWSNLDEDVFHSIVHAGGQPGRAVVPHLITNPNDLTYLGATYKDLLAACEPLVPDE